MAIWDTALPEVFITVDRRRLARRLWRAAADNGSEFGAEVEAPLKHGEVVWADAKNRYVIRQAAEPLIGISLAVEAGTAAIIGWAVGNLHLAIESRGNRLLAPDEPGLRQTLDRLDIPYTPCADVFQPHRLADSLAGHGQLNDRTGEALPPH